MIEYDTSMDKEWESLNKNEIIHPLDTIDIPD